MGKKKRPPTTYEVLQSHGVNRRSFLKFCTATAAAVGLDATMIPQIVRALETEPRIPVIWLHGLECTCCSESFIRSAHPITQDVVLNMILLDYDDTLQAAAGHQVEEIRKQIMRDYPGKYILAVEGNAPTKDGGVYCTIAGETFESTLKETAENAMAVVAWGSCASNGCVQAAHPNPTGAKPGTVHVLTCDEVLNSSPSDKCPTAHGSGAAELLRAASLLGSLPNDVTIVGIEPETVRTGIGLTDPVKRSLNEASQRVSEALKAASSTG